MFLNLKEQNSTVMEIASIDKFIGTSGELVLEPENKISVSDYILNVLEDEYI